MTDPLSSSLAAAAGRIHSEQTRPGSKEIEFSRNARAKLEVIHADFVGDLGQESIRIARRSSLSTVDETHVCQAGAKLASGVRVRAVESTLNTIGGLLVGAGMAASYAIVFTAGPHGVPEIITALILSGCGIALLAIGQTLTYVARSK